MAGKTIRELTANNDPARTRLIVTQDPTTGEITKSTLAQGLGKTLAGDVTYDLDVTGSAERSLKAKLERLITFRDFGAVGDGADNGTGGATGTDDTAAITAAITAAAARGAPVDGEGLTYRHNSSIALPAGGSTYIKNANFVTGASMSGSPFAFSNSGAMESFGFEKVRYIDPRVASELPMWASIVINASSTNTALPPLRFFMRDCYFEAGTVNVLRYRVPTETNTTRYVTLENSEFKGRIRTDLDQVAVNINGSDDVSNALVYNELNVRISHFRAGIRVRACRAITAHGGHISHCADSFALYFGVDKTSVDPDVGLDSITISNKICDASAGTYSAVEGKDQKLLVFGLYAGPINVMGCQLYGDRVKTKVGISVDAVRGTDSTDEGHRVIATRDILLGNTIKSCQWGIAQNNHREWNYSHNVVAKCDLGIVLQHSSLPAHYTGITASNTISDCGTAIRYHTLYAGAGGARYRNNTDNNLVEQNTFVNCAIEVESIPRADFGGSGPGYEGLVAQHNAQRRITAATNLVHSGTPHIIVASGTAGMVLRLPFARRQRVGQRLSFFNESTETFALKPARLLFDDAHVNLTDNLVALPADALLYSDAQRDFATGDRVVLASAGTLPAPLVQGRVYYIVHNPLNRTLSTGGSTGQEEIAFAATHANALAGTLIDITSVTGSQTGHIVGDGYWDETGALQTAESDSDVIATTERLVELVSVPGGWLRTR